jgi:hypothetical protein
MNAIMDEIVNVIEDEGITLVKANSTQLLAAITAKLQTEVVPVGNIEMTIRTTAPARYLLMNGDTIGKTGSGATHEDDDFETLFDLVKLHAPNTGSEDFDSLDTVTLANMAKRMPIGLDSATAAINAIAETGGAFDHSHTVDAHGHSIGSHTHPITGRTASDNGFFAFGSAGAGSLANPSHDHGVGTLATSGSGGTSADATPGTDDNNPPFIALNFIIRAK